MDYPARQNDFLLEHARLLRSSFSRYLYADLLSIELDDSVFAEQLFQAPFAVLSHSADTDPKFNYANLTALKLFELNWDELLQLPSRESAELVNQAARQRLLQKVADEGYIVDYEGVRISKKGRRFKIQNAIVWNLHDELGVYQGQAVYFNQWEFL